MGFLDDLKKLTRPYAEDAEDDSFEEFEAEESAPRQTASARRPAFDPDVDLSQPAERRRGGNSKVVNINATTQMQVVLAKPDRFDMVSEIADHLRSKHAVVLNLEATNRDVARRLVDFLSGCAYALDGKIKKIAVSTFLITPYNVDIVGDVIDELENNGVYL
ncbi:MAG: cell division protein SepF [Oscillospiraceae bacterium]|nr:cell division protein SepF [Oscillospiraceae bacterium]